MARHWKIRERKFSLSRPLIMGILNVTPDSFSDGGRFSSSGDAALAALEMVADGADIIDIGGESTRPGATEVDEQTELSRVLPAVRTLRRVTDAPVSIDTRRASVARAALEEGADIVNDVSALADPAMAEVVRVFHAGVVLMHGFGGESADGVRDFLRERIDFAAGAGIDPGTIVIDPGIGFAKTTDENIAVLKALPELAALGVPVLVGLSRKRFIGEITHVAEPAERVAGSVAAMLWTIWHGASIVRVHDVRATREAIDIASAIASGS